MSVQELETAVTRLSKEEHANFSQWLEEYRADEWDQEIEARYSCRTLRRRRAARQSGLRGGTLHPAVSHFASKVKDDLATWKKVEEVCNLFLRKNRGCKPRLLFKSLRS